MQKYFLYTMCVALLVSCAGGQQDQSKPEKQVANDSNTPLHLMKPDYKKPYGIPATDSVKAVIDRVLTYIDQETPMSVDKRGAFRLASYEWGVTYGGAIRAGETTGDKAFTEYTTKRLTFLQETVTALQKNGGEVRGQFRQILHPHALDDAGAMCVAFIKASMVPGADKYTGIIENYMKWIMEGQFRLKDGTLARVRPHLNTLWLDDMFMGIPAMAWMGRYTNDQKYYLEAIKQIKSFASRMWVPEKKLFMHGWVEGMDVHPTFFWGRANGWAVMTLVEVLEAIPPTTKGYGNVMNLLKQHIEGLAALQSGEGLWHQLLDRNDSYLETSATAIYVYAMARAINNGWIDTKAYGPRVLLAWNAISTQVNHIGQVENVCVGTGMGFDPAFYYYRPVSVYAAHGYGPVLLAGAEVIELLKRTHPKMNDSAVQFYHKAIPGNNPIFDEPE